MDEAIEEIRAFGHSLVRATHKTTFEVTREDHLTERGDCIIAVKADKAARDLSERFRDIARRPNAEIIIIIEANGERDVVRAYGSPRLTLTHSMDIVVRKSSYVCARTVAIGADKAACNLSRKLIEKLRNPRQEVRIILSART
ncbi:MAG: DUF371 domain-containing protein [Candidatus Bathyarchaeia archaeon]